MPNTILTPNMITKEALKVLHEKLVFLNKVNRQYDNSFAQKGAKIGSILRIKKPAQFTVRDGSTYAGQDFVQTEVALEVSNQKGIDVTFTDFDLALSMDDFSESFLKPAMAQLATSIEEDVASVILESKNSVYNATGITFKDFNKARASLVKSLAPSGNWIGILNPDTHANVVDALKGLFQDSSAIAKQYREGLVGRTAGFDYYESNILPKVENMADIVGTVTVTQGATTALLAGLGNAVTIPKGFRFTVAGIKKVHAETKVPYADLYEFVVKEAVTTDGSGNATVSIEPIFATTARKNISAIPGAGAAITAIGSASAVLRNNVFFQKDAFTFATADLDVPSGTDRGSREMFDGISLRFARDWDITTGSWRSRFDVAYAFAAIRPELACLGIEPDTI